jgi:diguanylate cyclase (GGDEF)-like protein
MNMFNLTRYFSTLSFILITLAAGLLGLVYRELSVAQLMRLAEDRNVAMTQVFRNTLWPHYADFARRAGLLPVDSLRAAPEIARLRAEVMTQMHETDVIKAKIYDRTGNTVFSSDPRQIGENKSTNAGFRSALDGRVASELTHRNTFDAFEGALSDLDVISSYVPIRRADGEIEGVFELYQNVTPFLAYVQRTYWWITGSLLGVFGLLFIGQFLVVRRAQLIIKHQEASLEAANHSLEDRVRSRTAELEKANSSLESEISERRAAEARLEHLAHHDPLTGLPNRLMFNEQFDRGIRRAERNEQQIAVLFIDLDHFKDVNDTLGHAFGDRLLKIVASRLAADMRGSDTLVRLGGDEFIYLIEEIRNPIDAGTVANKLIERLETAFVIDGNELHLTASIGISLFPGDGDSVDVLVRNADTAMYQAKAQGRNSYHFYTSEMTTYAVERLKLGSLLRRAVENKELSLHFQPQVDSTSGRLLGAEALLRWNSPELGSVSPVRFIPIAEETGSIVPIGEWVLREACRQVAAWDASGFRLPKISVNLSVKQIESTDVVGLVERMLVEHALAPERLELEITESVIMTVDDAIAVLGRLRKLGVHLSIDDFGTGYSSLAYLKLLPISKLKIDRAFVVGIGENSGDEAIIRTIVALSQSLGLDIIAEGVETTAQGEFLAGEGCPNVQGYLHGKPVDAESFEQDWIKRLRL